MGSRTKPNHGGSGMANTRKSRPSPARTNKEKYGPISSVEELEIYLSGKKIMCLLCGEDFKSLGHHLTRSHSISSRKYKIKFNIPTTRSISCSELRVMKRNIMLGVWDGNEKMEEVRLNLRKNAKKNLSSGCKNRSKSTLAGAANNKKLKAIGDEVRVRQSAQYRDIYLDIINRAITNDLTIYKQCQSDGHNRVTAIYNYAKKNKDDLEFCQRLDIAKEKGNRNLPVGIKLTANGKYMARWSNNYIGTFSTVCDAGKARKNYIEMMGK